MKCIKCSGTGLGDGPAKVARGDLLPLCGECRGAGEQRLANALDEPFRAIWCVGDRYIVRMTVPVRKGEFVELDIEWTPQLPPLKGAGKLGPREIAQYERGRDDALRLHMHNMGGGDFSIVTAGDRH